MATQLSTGGFRGLRAGAVNLRVRPRYLVAAAFLLLALAIVSNLLALTSARMEDRAARARFGDTLALLDLPPPDVDDARSELELLRSGVARAETLVASPALDLQSDDATGMLVRAAEDAGLSVRGVDRTAETVVKVQDQDYTRRSLRLAVEGPAASVVALVASLEAAQPALVASLDSLDVAPVGVRATLLFSTHESVDETTAPEAAP
jgi:hypothetical protein